MEVEKKLHNFYCLINQGMSLFISSFANVPRTLQFQEGMDGSNEYELVELKEIKGEELCTSHLP